MAGVKDTVEKEYSMNDIFNFMRAMSDDIKQSVNIKLESSFVVVNSRFDSNDEKFDNKFDKLSSDVNAKLNELSKRFDIHEGLSLIHI